MAPVASESRAAGAKGGADGSVMTMEHKEGEAVDEAAVDPPWWEPEACLVPGLRCAKVVASPCATFKSLGDFFRCHIAAEVDEQAWSMRLTAFLDYVAVNMKVEVYRDTAGDPNTVVTDCSLSVVMFQHISQDDLITFNHVCSLVLKHLSENSLQMSELGGALRPSPMLSDDDFDDDLFHLPEEWPVTVESALEAVSCPERAGREQGIQALARWAELRLDHIPALTDALIKRGSLVGELFNAPLAECYPLAVTLKVASRRPQEAERLAESILPLLPWPRAGVPSLAARELEETFGNLITAAVTARKGVCKAAESLGEYPGALQEDLSPASTCEPEPFWRFTSSWSESSRSSTWGGHRSGQRPQRDSSETLVLSEGEHDFTGNFISE